MNEPEAANSVLPNDAQSRRSALLASSVLIVAALAVYANSMAGDFVFDDHQQIVANESIHSLGGWWQALDEMSRPLVMLTLALNYAVHGLSVPGYHAVNIVIHILAALTLYGIVRRTLLSESLRDRYARSAPWLALAAALIWLVHPLQTQAVTYIIQRSEALMGLFYLLTLYCVIRCAQGRSPYVWVALAVLVCALGMASKEVMVTAPLVMLIYDRTFLSGSWRRALQRRWILYGGLAGTWWILFETLDLGVLVSKEASVGFAIEQIRPLDYLQTQPAVIWHYLRLSVWPHPLCFDYVWKPAKDAEGFVNMLSFIIPMVLLLAAIAWAVWRRSWLGVLGAWFFLILAPTSSIMPLFDLAVEHRMYLPLAAVVVLFVVVADRLLAQLRSARVPAACALMLVVVMPLAWLTAARNRVYESNRTLWQSVIDIRPQNPRGYYNLGTGLVAHDQLAEAADLFRKAIELSPTYVHAHNNLGNVYRSQDEPDKAIEHFRLAVRYNPKYALGHYNLARMLRTQGQLSEALPHYLKTIELGHSLPEALNNAARIMATHIDPAVRNPAEAVRLAERAAELTDHDNPTILETLALAYYSLGAEHTGRNQLDEATAAFQNALAIKPGYYQAHNFARILSVQGRLKEALPHYLKAIEQNSDLLDALNDAAWIMATHAESDVRNPTEAVRLAERAVALTEHSDPRMLDTLAAAYAAAGEFDRAVTTLESALKLAEANEDVPLTETLRRHLQLYQQGKPYAEPPRSDER